MKPKKRQTILLILMLLMGFLVFRQYLPMVEIPTAGRVEEKRKELQSVQDDLLVAEKVYQERLASIQALQDLAAPYWIPANTTTKVDQEILSEFNRLTRLSQQSRVITEQNVEEIKGKTGSCLQEIDVNATFTNVSMRDLTRFFNQMRNDPKGRKFRWKTCKIQPNNAKSPTAVNMRVCFKVLVLNNEALEFLGLVEKPAASKAATPKGTTAPQEKNARNNRTKK